MKKVRDDLKEEVRRTILDMAKKNLSRSYRKSFLINLGVDFEGSMEGVTFSSEYNRSHKYHTYLFIDVAGQLMGILRGSELLFPSLYRYIETNDAASDFPYPPTEADKWNASVFRELPLNRKWLTAYADKVVRISPEARYGMNSKRVSLGRCAPERIAYTLVERLHVYKANKFLNISVDDMKSGILDMKHKLVEFTFEDPECKVKEFEFRLNARLGVAISPNGAIRSLILDIQDYAKTLQEVEEYRNAKPIDPDDDFTFEIKHGLDRAARILDSLRRDYIAVSRAFNEAF